MTTTATTPAPVPVPGRGRRFTRNRADDTGGGQGAASPLAQAAVWFICLLWVVPIIGQVVTAFRPKDDANANGWWNVVHDPNFTTQNFVDAWNKSGLGDAFVNSFAIALPATLIPIMVAAFAAYAFAFMRFPFRDTLFFLISMIVPIVVFLSLQRFFVRGLTAGSVKG